MKPLNVDRHKSEFIHYNAITNLIKKQAADNHEDNKYTEVKNHFTT